MKKIILITSIIFMLLCLNVSAEEIPNVEIYNPTNIINITGQLTDNQNQTVTILMQNGDGEYVHIGEATPDSNGLYRSKFKYTGDISECSVMVNQNGVDVTQSVVESISYEEAFIATVKVVRNSQVNASLEIENYFNITDKKYTIVIASYDGAGVLVNAKKSDAKSVDFDKTVDSLTADVEENVETIKIFAWDTLGTMLPLCTPKVIDSKSEINVLAIGNSFTDDPIDYLKQIAAVDDVTINIDKLVKGGCDLKTHWEAWENDDAVYNGEKKITDYLNENNNYDYIIFQQASQDSGRQDTYSPYAENMVKYLREKQPYAEIVLQQVWAYEKGSTHYGFAYYNNDQEQMYNDIKSVTEYWCTELGKLTTDSGLPVSSDGEPLRYIPTGDAVQNARANAKFDTTYVSGETDSRTSLNRDGYHLSYNYGRYLAALTWYGSLTGNNVLDNKYSNSTYPISDADKSILRSAAQKAIDDNGRW